MSQNKTSLKFAGNRMWISPRVSITLTSAFITFAGCLSVIIVAVLLA